MVPTPTGIEFTYKIPDVVKLLFETPSGFALFSFDETYLDKDIEDIWAYFVGEYWHQNIIWLHEFQKFEDKSDAIDLAKQKIGKGMNMMLMKYCYTDDKLIVGSLAYKEIIEGSLGITCVYNDDAVTEINERIIEKARMVHHKDLREDQHFIFLQENLVEDFNMFSKVDIEDWSLFKLATALKLMVDPYGGLKAGDACEMFTRAELTMMWDDAQQYQGTIDKDTILAIYNDAVTLREDTMELLYELKCLVEEAEATLATEEELC